MEKEVNQYLKKLNEPSNKEHHIVKPLSIIENESPICTYIVTEYCSGGDLARYVKSVPGERVEESKAKDIIRQVSTGLLFLHRGNFIHRDIKAANILIDERANESTNQKDAIYKIADFGLATKLNRRKDLKTVCGTKRFMAPEMTGYTEYGPEVDIWSLGVLFFSLLVGKHPTVDSTKVEIYEPIKSAYQKPIYPKDLGISEDTQTLVNKMLEVDPMLRISIVKLQSTLSTYTKYPKSPATNSTI
jgi:serine/threonine protein kinase